MDQDKVKSILDWPSPKNLKELQSFLGLCNYYRKFIKNFAGKMEPLRKLLKKNNGFIWDNTRVRVRGYKNFQIFISGPSNRRQLSYY